MVYCILFTVTLSTKAQERPFLEAFRQLQQHYKQHEPGLITYELHRDESNPLRYCVVERYASREDVKEVHKQSAPLQHFLAALQRLDISNTSRAEFSSDRVMAELQSMPVSADDVQLAARVADASAAPLRQQKGVLVFCGSRVGAKRSYVAEAEALGEYLAVTCRLPLVYGGGTVGVMGAVARATKQHGGRVVAVTPHALMPREVMGDMLGDVVYMTQTMSERKSIMFAHSSMVVALPGGLGTFDELLEVLTLQQLNAYQTKIGIVNVDGFFDPFLAHLQHMVREGFLEEYITSAFVVRPTAVELMQALESFTPPSPPGASLQWHTRP
ncbi:lysine decarboxylase-like protein [Trypanosoma grayi]|uniref:lysine decarboxylase-like protein n=1 Tax=Trypanosoma grayi TaxID=71804 RepID=UPI0004F490CA|nr:lysine decarboxylase-like protein [Trypanosoma grayi]KEG15070.1 lysine decarboxylase-like protein [Trypanosoma grayi]